MAHSLSLDTSRLAIVGINETNTAQVADYLLSNIDHVRTGGGQPPTTEEQVRKQYNAWKKNIDAGTEVRFFLLKKEKIIGIVGATNIVKGVFQACYLGYNIAEEHQGKGLMTEALTAIINYIFDTLNLHRIMANYRPDNLASGRVLEKLGFEKEGLAKDYLIVNGKWADHVLTSKINPSWIAE